MLYGSSPWANPNNIHWSLQCLQIFAKMLDIFWIKFQVAVPTPLQPQWLILSLRQLIQLLPMWPVNHFICCTLQLIPSFQSDGYKGGINPASPILAGPATRSEDQVTKNLLPNLCWDTRFFLEQNFTGCQLSWMKWKFQILLQNSEMSYGKVSKHSSNCIYPENKIKVGGWTVRFRWCH